MHMRRFLYRSSVLLILIAGKIPVAARDVGSCEPASRLYAVSGVKRHTVSMAFPSEAANFMQRAGDYGAIMLI